MPTSTIRALRYSARDVDPMSWFTGPYVPLVFAAFIAVYGGTMTIASWSQPELPGTQLVGVALCVLACLLVQVLTSLRNRFNWQLGAVVFVVAGAGFIVAALGYRRQDFLMEQWWAPFCFAIALSSLAPYLSTWRLLFWGVLPLLTIVPAVFVIIDARVPDWGSVSVFLILATPPAVAVAATTAFSYSVVHQMLPIVENRSSAVVSPALELDPEDEEAERVMLARYTARAVPFLRTVAERGTVSEGIVRSRARSPATCATTWCRAAISPGSASGPMTPGSWWSIPNGGLRRCARRNAPPSGISCVRCSMTRRRMPPRSSWSCARKTTARRRSRSRSTPNCPRADGCGTSRPTTSTCAVR
ncbi:hypothetical protein [Homoserinibacter gongjuensis]|uniref:Uncharacterized protein n=1 Tax=Homoserinibacter gongjuensis TaxID=1162968 RepID=A0ABQ6JY81_9MICO|nr:hypothetical protein [Homoserinibacter gongjuensis]GMA91652.1 hypothetical protein GCM10025869_21810 [Homoserinibacter gongjuensis]